MKTGSRPQYYRIRRMVQMVREGADSGSLPNSTDFMNEFEISRRTVARDLDFLRDEERAPLAYDDARHGFRLTDETYTLPPVRISRKEAFSFGLARKLLAHYEGTPLHLDMRSVLDKIAESLEGEITIEPDWLSEHVGVLPEDRVRIDPDVWAQLAGFIECREVIRATYLVGNSHGNPLQPQRRLPRDPHAVQGRRDLCHPLLRLGPGSARRDAGRPRRTAVHPLAVKRKRQPLDPRRPVPRGLLPHEQSDRHPQPFPAHQRLRLHHQHAPDQKEDIDSGPARALRPPPLTRVTPPHEPVLCPSRPLKEKAVGIHLTQVNTTCGGVHDVRPYYGW